MNRRPDISDYEPEGEGELKKRLEEARNKYGGEDGDYLAILEFMDVLDEAKNEFSSVDLRIGRHPKDTQTDSEILVEKSKEYRNLTKKWFGGLK